MSDLTDHRMAQIIEGAGGNFTPAEFGTGRQHGNPEVLRQVVLLRNWCGYKFQVTSYWRNKGAHSEGAVDWLIWSRWRQSQPAPMEIWNIATTWPWLGTGIYFDWEDGIGLHGDLAASRQRPLRWIRARGVYYYQSVKTGQFYDEDGNATTLEKEISAFNRKSND